MRILFEGAISVKAALESEYRQVIKVWMDKKKKNKDFGYILVIADKKDIEVERVSAEIIDEMAKGKTHGGVICEVSERNYLKTTDMNCMNNPFFVLIEGIEDAYNMGYALRTLYAAGCNGVFVTQVFNDEMTLTKSSAGASERMPIVLVNDTKKDLQHLIDEGVEIIGAVRKDAVDMYEIDYKKGILVAIGGPKRGLSSSIMEHCKQNLYVPYANDFRNSLNASSAVSIIAYEVYRQRR